MYKICLVVLIGFILLHGEPNLVELLRKYAETQAEIADMRRTVCPD